MYVPASTSYSVFLFVRPFLEKILREIKVELGKSDAEMQTDPLLSVSNLMRFDPDAEAGEFDLVAQEVSLLARLKNLCKWIIFEYAVIIFHRRNIF